MVRDGMTGGQETVGCVFNPDCCAACLQIVAARGIITNYVSDPQLNQVMVFASDPESIAVFNPQGKTQIKIVLALKDDKFQTCPACNTDVAAKLGVKMLSAKGAVVAGYVSVAPDKWTIPDNVLFGN